MITFSVHTIAGLLGALVTLAAYAALQLGLLRGQGYVYAGLNALGAGLVLFSMRDAFNLSSAIMQVAWITISAIGIGRYYVLTHLSRFTPEEEAFLEATMPGLGRIDSRRLLDLASWGVAEPGTRLTEAGERNDNVYYLLEGQAEVLAGDSLIARLDEHTFVGDMGIISGDEATATVAVSRRVRYLAFAVEPLHRLLDRNPEIRRHLAAALSGQVVRKLVRTSRDLADSRRSANGVTGEA